MKFHIFSHFYNFPPKTLSSMKLQKLTKQNTGSNRHRSHRKLNIVPLFNDCLLHVYLSSFSGVPCFIRLKNYLIEHVRHVIATLNCWPSTFNASVLLFSQGNLRYHSNGCEKTRKWQKNRRQIAEKRKKCVFVRDFPNKLFLWTDKPSVSLNCANFHSFLTCSVENYSNDLNFHQIYLSRERERARERKPNGDFPSQAKNITQEIDFFLVDLFFSLSREKPKQKCKTDLKIKKGIKRKSAREDEKRFFFIILTFGANEREKKCEFSSKPLLMLVFASFSLAVYK